MAVEALIIRRKGMPPEVWDWLLGTLAQFGAEMEIRRRHMPVVTVRRAYRRPDSRSTAWTDSHLIMMKMLDEMLPETIRGSVRA